MVLAERLWRQLGLIFNRPAGDENSNDADGGREPTLGGVYANYINNAEGL